MEIVISDLLQVTGGEDYFQEMAQERRSMTKSFRLSRAMDMLTYRHSQQSRDELFGEAISILRTGGNGNERQREKIKIRVNSVSKKLM